MTTIKEMPKTPIQKPEKPILSFRRTHEASVRNRKILPAFNGELGAEIAAQKYSPVNHGLEFCDTAALEKLFLYGEDRAKIINIFK